MIRFSIFEFFSGENQSLKWNKNKQKETFFLSLFYYQKRSKIEIRSITYQNLSIFLQLMFCKISLK